MFQNIYVHVHLVLEEKRGNQSSLFRWLKKHAFKPYHDPLSSEIYLWDIMLKNCCLNCCYMAACIILQMVFNSHLISAFCLFSALLMWIMFESLYLFSDKIWIYLTYSTRMLKVTHGSVCCVLPVLIIPECLAQKAKIIKYETKTELKQI